MKRPPLRIRAIVWKPAAEDRPGFARFEAAVVRQSEALFRLPPRPPKP
jgi:hypothetical protein